MKSVRRLILYLSSVIGVWVFASFGGTMFDPAHAELWTSSLMWALLSSLLVLPALVLVNHASLQTTEPKDRKQGAQVTERAKTQRRSTQEGAEQKSFTSEPERPRTLWPQSEKDWPASRSDVPA